MAKFDEVLADFQAKMDAAMAVVANYPDVAAEVRTAIENAQTAAEIAEQKAQDDARANALATMIVGVRNVLAEAVGAEVPVEPELR